MRRFCSNSFRSVSRRFSTSDSRKTPPNRVPKMPLKKKSQVVVTPEMAENIQKCRLISVKGVTQGTVSGREAFLSLSQNQELIIVKPDADLPTLRVMKKVVEKAQAKETKKTKEVKFGTKIADGDFNIRLDRIRKFLAKGHSVKVTIEFKRRAGKDVGLERNCKQISDSIIESLKDIATLDKPVKDMGFRNYLFLVPNPDVAAASSEKK